MSITDKYLLQPQILHGPDTTPTTSHLSALDKIAYNAHGEKKGLKPSSTLLNTPVSLVDLDFRSYLFRQLTCGDIGRA